jgi:hypothetical protein
MTPGFGVVTTWAPAGAAQHVRAAAVKMAIAARFKKRQA